MDQQAHHAEWQPCRQGMQLQEDDEMDQEAHHDASQPHQDVTVTLRHNSAGKPLVTLRHKAASERKDKQRKREKEKKRKREKQTKHKKKQQQRKQQPAKQIKGKHRATLQQDVNEQLAQAGVHVGAGAIWHFTSTNPYAMYRRDADGSASVRPLSEGSASKRAKEDVRALDKRIVELQGHIAQGKGAMSAERQELASVIQERDAKLVLLFTMLAIALLPAAALVCPLLLLLLPLYVATASSSSLRL